MPRRRKVKDGRWLANIKQGYYQACKGLGLSVSFQCDADIAEAIIYAVHQNGEDIQKVYEHLARRNMCTKEVIQHKVDRQLLAAHTEIGQRFTEAEARQLIERYFGDEDADILKPEVFIYGLSQYLRRNR